MIYSDFQLAKEHCPQNKEEIHKRQKPLFDEYIRLGTEIIKETGSLQHKVDKKFMGEKRAEIVERIFEAAKQEDKEEELESSEGYEEFEEIKIQEKVHQSNLVLYASLSAFILLSLLYL